MIFDKMFQNKLLSLQTPSFLQVGSCVASAGARGGGARVSAVWRNKSRAAGDDQHMARNIIMGKEQRNGSFTSSSQLHSQTDPSKVDSFSRFSIKQS